jgi:hypothetical protein
MNSHSALSPVHFYSGADDTKILLPQAILTLPENSCTFHLTNTINVETSGSFWKNQVWVGAISLIHDMLIVKLFLKNR